MRLTLVRHATLLVDLAGTRWLVDPQFDPAGARPPIDGTPEPRPNPLVDLPVPPERVMEGVDAVIVTHLHQDHLDGTAIPLLRGLPVYCQPADLPRLAPAGLPVRPLAGEAEFAGVRLEPTGGRHGTGEVGAMMGAVIGVVMRAEGEPTVYVAGDTVMCDEVREALARHRPDVIVVNAGAARFLEGDPITMDADDVVAVAREAPDATVVAVHMEAINHCGLRRDDLRRRLADEGLAGRVHVPEDGAALGD